MKKKQFIALTIALMLIFVSLPTKSAKALIGPAFGGLVSFSIPCTCSFMLWVWHTPLWLGPVMLTGPMIYSPFSTIPHPNYLFGVPSRWDLGSYIPGVQACWMYAGFFCFPLPAIGIMTEAGTS